MSPAVDWQRYAGAEWGAIGSEEEHRLGDFLRLPNAAQSVRRRASLEELDADAYSYSLSVLLMKNYHHKNSHES